MSASLSVVEVSKSMLAPRRYRPGNLSLVDVIEVSGVHESGLQSVLLLLLRDHLLQGEIGVDLVGVLLVRSCNSKARLMR